MHSDERIYADMCGDVTQEDIQKVQRVLRVWADATDDLGADVRTVFLACVNTIATMGQAYCRIAAANLVERALERAQL
jgi:hypothetical protein